MLREIASEREMCSHPNDTYKANKTSSLEYIISNSDIITGETKLHFFKKI